MKILHTADWHIGKLVHGIHMTNDQRYILKELIRWIEEQRPDVLIIAGDLYDRSIPPVEAVELLDEVLTELVMNKDIAVLAIAGNHDSPDRVSFAGNILKKHGLHLVGHLQLDIEPIIIEDDEGPVHFYMVPYVEPVIVRELYEDESIKTHDDAMVAIMGRIKSKMLPEVRNVCVAHAYLMGIEKEEVSESVRPLSIGGSEFVDAAHFDGFDYVALGHLHRAQKVGKETIRYSGSLLKYSFSEALQVKSVTEVIMSTESTRIETHQLPVLRDMRVLKGALDHLVDEEVYKGTNTEDYVMATLTDKGELIDPINVLRAIYPNVLRVEKESYEREAGEQQTSAGEDFIQKGPVGLFEEFYENISGEYFDEQKQTIVGELVDDLMKKGRIKG